jgi:hypothetical protein
MTKTIGLIVLAAAMLGAYGCASTMESANKGAETVGETGGRVLRLPSSVSEGAAGGIAGEPEKNPYGR